MVKIEFYNITSITSITTLHIIIGPFLSAQSFKSFMTQKVKHTSFYIPYRTSLIMFIYYNTIVEFEMVLLYFLADLINFNAHYFKFGTHWVCEWRHVCHSSSWLGRLVAQNIL